MQKGNYIRSQIVRSLGVDVKGGIKMTALETYVADKERNENVKKVRSKIDELGIEYSIVNLFNMFSKFINCAIS